MADEVVKRGRGRPRGSRNKPRPEAALQAAVAAGPSTAKRAVPEPAIARPATPARPLADLPMMTPIAIAIVADAAAPVEAAVRKTIDQGKVLAAAAAEASKKDVDKMANAAETMTANGANAAEAGADRAKAVFGDINERAKSAMEKSTKVFEDMVEFAKGNVEAAVASSRAAAKGAETMIQDATEYGRKNLEKVQGAARSYASVKSPTDFLQLSTDFSRSTFDAMVAEASRFSEAYVKVVSDVVEPISSRFSVAAERFKSAAL